MKKITLLVAAIVTLITYVNAQSQRLVLFEEFTQASCPPCASTNPGLNAILHASGNDAKIIPIKYQTSWPGYDPMNLQNASPVATRVSYYSVTGVPHGVEDGNVYSAQPSTFTQAMINTRYAVVSPFTMTLTHSFNSTLDSVYVNLDITCTQAITATLKCRVVLCEREIEFCTAPGTNGESDFSEVMRDMYPSAAGTAMAAAWTVGQTQNITFAKKLPTYIYDKSTLDVVAFIQDDGTKEVKQAAVSFPQPIALDARITCVGVNGIPAVSCGAPVSATVEIENTGTSTLTSCDIVYTLDGNNTTLPWTGSLAPGATASVTIPNMNPASGSHTLNVTVANPNGAMDYNNYYDSKSTVFSTYSSTGTNLPLVYAFAPVTFPPVDWFLVNADAGPTWTRSTAGLSGAGSAKIDFYHSPNAQVDILGTNNYDFSINGTTSAQIDFDVAYCQYGTENDRLQVEYSTDCGATWTGVYNEAGTTLASGNPANTGDWVPTSAGQWHHKTAQLTGAVGQPNVFIRFKATSNYGNNGYVDNINVSTNLTTSVAPIASGMNVSIYPNPSNGIVNVDMNLDNAQDVSIVVTNALGAVVASYNYKDVTKGSFPLNLEGQSKGNYIVTVKTNDNVTTKRISITE